MSGIPGPSLGLQIVFNDALKLIEVQRIHGIAIVLLNDRTVRTFVISFILIPSLLG
jgi:hypothetical protein